MKKSYGIKICAAVLILVVCLIIFAFLLPKPAPIPEPTFKFLSGRTLTAKAKTNQLTKRETHYLYSFEADFGDVVADANSELSIWDFYKSSIDEEGTDITEIQRRLPGKKPIDNIVVRLIKNQKMNISSNPKNSVYKTSVPYVYSKQEGWVSVVVIQRQKKNWLIYHFNKILDKLRNK